jgi:hypothetical protein
LKSYYKIWYHCWQFSIKEHRIHACIFKLYCHRLYSRKENSLTLGIFVFILIANKSFVDIGGIVEYQFKLSLRKKTNEQVFLTLSLSTSSLISWGFQVCHFHTQTHIQIIEVVLTSVLNLCLCYLMGG